MNTSNTNLYRPNVALWNFWMVWMWTVLRYFLRHIGLFYPKENMILIFFCPYPENSGSVRSCQCGRTSLDYAGSFDCRASYPCLRFSSLRNPTIDSPSVLQCCPLDAYRSRLSDSGGGGMDICQGGKLPKTAEWARLWHLFEHGPILETKSDRRPEICVWEWNQIHSFGFLPWHHVKKKT